MELDESKDSVGEELRKIYKALRIKRQRKGVYTYYGRIRGGKPKKPQ